MNNPQKSAFLYNNKSDNIYVTPELRASLDPDNFNGKPANDGRGHSTYMLNPLLISMNGMQINM